MLVVNDDAKLPILAFDKSIAQSRETKFEKLSERHNRLPLYGSHKYFVLNDEAKLSIFPLDALFYI